MEWQNSQSALILPEVASVMGLGQYAPYFGSQFERVRHHLKYNVAVLCTVAVTSQCGKAQCMGFGSV